MAGERFESVSTSCKCAPGYMPKYFVVALPPEEKPEFAQDVAVDAEFADYPTAEQGNFSVPLESGPTCWPCVSDMAGPTRGYYKASISNEKCQGCSNLGLEYAAGRMTTEPVQAADNSSRCKCLGGWVRASGEELRCIPCENGTYARSGDANCSECLAGTFSEQGAGVCEACPAPDFLWVSGPGASECEFEWRKVVVAGVAGSTIAALALYCCVRAILRLPCAVRRRDLRALQKKFKKHIKMHEENTKSGERQAYDVNLFFREACRLPSAEPAKRRAPRFFKKRRARNARLNGELIQFTVPADCEEFGSMKELFLCLEQMLIARGPGSQFTHQEEALLYANFELFWRWYADTVRDCRLHPQDLEQPVIVGIVSFLNMYNQMCDKLVSDEPSQYQTMTEAADNLAAEARGGCSQTEENVCRLWERALAVRPLYEQLLQRLGQETGRWVELGKPKHLWRILEKSAGNANSPVRVCDIARAMVVCDNFEQHAKVLRFILGCVQDGLIELLRLKQRYRNPSAGGWRDIMLNFAFAGSAGTPLRLGDQGDAHTTGHVCELQIVHAKMLLLRAGAGGHADYNNCRAALELLELAVGEAKVQRFVAMLADPEQRAFATVDLERWQAKRHMKDRGIQWEFLGEAPAILRVVSPTHLTARAGVYHLVPGLLANGFPVWDSPSGAYLFSDIYGYWRVGAHWSKNRGWFVSQVQHNGLYPHQVLRWKYWRRSSWHMADNIEVRVESRPTVGDMVEIVRAEHPNHRAFLGQRRPICCDQRDEQPYQLSGLGDAWFWERSVATLEAARCAGATGLWEANVELQRHAVRRIHASPANHERAVNNDMPSARSQGSGPHKMLREKGF